MIVYHGLHRPRCPVVNICRFLSVWTNFINGENNAISRRAFEIIHKFEDKSRIEFEKFGEISRAPFQWQN